jgi:hypothetical protein
MIISASRRTDIPAFYADWFIRRIRAGYCLVTNPFNSQQVQRVSLLPDDVDCIVFWTRNPRPLFHHLAELDALGFRYYFQYTLMNNPSSFDSYSPRPPGSVATFHQLASLLGAQRVIWRYDPIVLSQATPVAWHLDTYARLAGELAGATRRSVISIMDPYPKIQKRMEALAAEGARLHSLNQSEPQYGDLMSGLAAAATANGMEITSCAEEQQVQRFGITPGKCIDDRLITTVFGIEVGHAKDPSQRKACGCVVSKDIGTYDTCLFGCSYCYATSSFARAQRRHANHDPDSASLVPLPKTASV